MSHSLLYLPPVKRVSRYPALSDCWDAVGRRPAKGRRSCCTGNDSYKLFQTKLSELKDNFKDLKYSPSFQFFAASQPKELRQNQHCQAIVGVGVKFSATADLYR